VNRDKEVFPIICIDFQTLVVRFSEENPPTREEFEKALEYSRFILKYRELADSSLVTQAKLFNSKETRWRKRIKRKEQRQLEERTRRQKGSILGKTIIISSSEFREEEEED